MGSLSTVEYLRGYYGRESTKSLKGLLFESSEKPLSIRDRLLELQSIDRAQANNCWESALDYFLEFHNSFIVMSDTEKQIIRDRYDDLGQTTIIRLTNGRLSDSALNAFPDFPRLPRLPIPNAINIKDVAKFIVDKLEGVIGNLAQTIKEIVLGIPEELFFIIEGFVTRITLFGELLRDGKVDQALGTLLESVALLIRDTAGSIVTIVANAVNDLVSGLLGGLITARSLTQAEIDFAHSIFHGKINLTFVQISALAAENAGMVAGSTIFMDEGIDLNDLFSRALFAHELTHVWENQRLAGAGTRTATKEQLSHVFKGAPDPYALPIIDNNTRWQQLGAEQRAEVVDSWQHHFDTTISGRFPNPSPIPGPQVGAFQNLVNSVGLF